MKNNKFIITYDMAIAQKLKDAGFISLNSQSNNKYVFINASSIKFDFSCVDKTKICFSNILNI